MTYLLVKADFIRDEGGSQERNVMQTNYALCKATRAGGSTERAIQTLNAVSLTCAPCAMAMLCPSSSVVEMYVTRSEHARSSHLARICISQLS